MMQACALTSLRSRRRRAPAIVAWAVFAAFGCSSSVDLFRDSVQTEDATDPTRPCTGSGCSNGAPETTGPTPEATSDPSEYQPEPGLGYEPERSRGDDVSEPSAAGENEDGDDDAPDESEARDAGAPAPDRGTPPDDGGAPDDSGEPQAPPVPPDAGTDGAGPRPGPPPPSPPPRR
jgi:hypothetical protein